ncbi:MAG: glycosyltransferase [Phycisphaerales bacterium]|nr:MAG: glycosyltransferase [Phycisphaerales bacterium]
MGRDDELHVVVVTDTFFETNGVGTYYKTLLKWCHHVGGMRMTVLCPARDDVIVGKIPESVIPVRTGIQCRNPFYKDLTLGYYSEKKMREIIGRLDDPKVVHIATSGALGVAGANAARHLRLPMVGCYHTDLQHYGRIYGRSLLGRPGEWLGGKAALLCDKFAYGHCEALYGASASAEATARSFFSGRTEIIPCPIDTERFHPDAKRAGRFRDQYCKNGAVLAAIVGRIAKEKNLDLICELLGNDERIRPVFVGDGPYAPTLRKRWNARITGFLVGNDLVEAYQQSDVFVQLSVSETFGLTLIEALACGLPAIVLRAKGLVDSIPPGSGVEILEKEHLPTLADRCVALVHDPKQHAERSRLVREYALTMGPEMVIPRFVEFHRQYLR